jgi:hypothetical protein
MAESVQKLRPQLAFLGIAAADQHEAGGMAHAQPLPLHHVLAGRRDIEQQIDQVVLEQIDLVDIKEPAMRAGQQARFKNLDTLAQSALEIERPDNAVLGGTQRQVHHRHRRQHRAQRSLRQPLPACLAQRILVGGITAITAIRHHLYLGQQSGQSAHGSRFAGATVAKHQYAADPGIDSGQQQTQPGFFLADNG